MKSSTIKFPRGGCPEQKHLKQQVTIFIHRCGYTSLVKACEKVGVEYQLIYRQLSGYQDLKLSNIEAFVQALDPTKKIDLLNGKPTITNIKG